MRVVVALGGNALLRRQEVQPSHAWLTVPVDGIRIDAVAVVTAKLGEPGAGSRWLGSSVGVPQAAGGPSTLQRPRPP
jgi:hypothetical protein